MTGIHLKTAPRAHLAPVVSVAASPAPTSRAVATFCEREAQLQTRADAIRREIEPALGDCGMVLGDRDLDGLSRAIASGSALARSVTVELIARRLNLEELALEIPDELIVKENYGLDPVF